MLRPKKKISKRELKEDALVSSYVKLTTFYEENKRNISIVVTVVVLAVLASVIYVKNRSDNNEKAITALGSIFEVFDARTVSDRRRQMPEKNIQGLKSIVENDRQFRLGRPRPVLPRERVSSSREVRRRPQGFRGLQPVGRAPRGVAPVGNRLVLRIQGYVPGSRLVV